MKAKTTLKDNVQIVVRGPDGTVKHASVHNTMGAAGLEGTAEQLLDTPSLYVVPGWMAIGEGVPTGFGLTDKLGDELPVGGTTLGRIAFTTKTRTGAVVTMVGDWGAGEAEGVITEAGLFDVVTPDTLNMWAGTNFPAINVGALDTLQITWTITVS
jgi:hypothetical protein